MSRAQSNVNLLYLIGFIGVLAVAKKTKAAPTPAKTHILKQMLARANRLRAHPWKLWHSFAAVPGEPGLQMQGFHDVAVVKDTTPGVSTPWEAWHWQGDEWVSLGAWSDYRDAEDAAYAVELPAVGPIHPRRR